MNNYILLCIAVATLTSCSYNPQSDLQELVGQHPAVAVKYLGDPTHITNQKGYKMYRWVDDFNVNTPVTKTVDHTFTEGLNTYTGTSQYRGVENIEVFNLVELAVRNENIVDFDFKGNNLQLFKNGLKAFVRDKEAARAYTKNDEKRVYLIMANSSIKSLSKERKSPPFISSR